MRDDIRTKNDKLNQAGTRTSLIAGVVLFGKAKGIPFEVLERATGVSHHDLVDPEARLPDTCLGAAWKTIGDAFPGEAPALEMAAAAPLSIFGSLAQAARYAETQLDALRTFVQYQKALSGGLEMALTEIEHQVILTVAHSQDAVDNGHGSEAALAMGARLGKEVLGTEASVVAVEFAHSANGPLDAYQRFFEHEVRFDSPRNAMVFSRAGLEAAPLQPDPEMYRYIEAHLDLVEKRLLEQTENEPLENVRRAIVDLAKRAEYGTEALAEELGMSLRTLQRFTVKHGVALKDLIDEVRQANASRLLSEDRLSIEEVAFLVGYSDDRAFRRAYKRWTGESPAAFRRKARRAS